MNWRVSGSLIAIIASGAVFSTHSTGNIFPWLPTALLISLAFLLLSDGNKIVKALTAGVLASLYTAYIFAFVSPLLLNMDPDKVSIAVQRIVDTGGVKGIKEYGYYYQVPGFHVWGSMLAHSLGISGQDTVRIIGSFLPFATVVGATTLVSQVAEKRAIVPAGVLAAASASVLYYAMAPIPQLLAVFLWIPFVILLHRLVTNVDARSFFLLVGLLPTLAFSHKISLVISIAAVSGVLVMFLLASDSSPTGRGTLRNLTTVFVLTVAFAAIQNIWISDFIRAIVISKLLVLLSLNSTIATTISPSAADPVLPGVQGILIRNISWLSLIAIAGLSSVWVLLRRERLRTSSAILGTTAATAAIIAVSFAAPSTLAIGRLMLFATVPLAAVSGLGISWLLSSDLSGTKSIAAVVIVVLLIAQLGVTGAVPDHQYEPREYLTVDEGAAKKWTGDHSPNPVHADYFYARETVAFDRLGQTYITGDSTTPLGFALIETAYVNNNVTVERHPYLLYRPNYERYQIAGAWELRYNPEEQFDTTRQRVYDSGGGIFYTPGFLSTITA